MPPAIAPMLDALTSMDEVSCLAILDRQGVLLAEHKKGGEFASYAAILVAETEKLNADLDLSPPQSLVVNKRTGSKILIIPGPHIIVGIELSSDASAGAIAGSMCPMVKRVAL